MAGRLVFNAHGERRISTSVTTTGQLQRADASTSDDSQLVARARAGDVSARDQLVATHLDAVYRLSLRILGDRDLAQDAAQDAFVNALGALGRFRGESSFRTWLLRIALNAARSVARRGVRRREVTLVAAESVAAGDDPAGRTATVMDAERARCALARLPEKQRLSVALRIDEGLSYAEIADVIGSTEGAARVNYHLGIKRLREMLR